MRAPMMAQASSSHVYDFDMQAWTEGLSRHVKDIQDAYASQARKKELAEEELSGLKAKMFQAREQNEEQARILEELHIARMAEMQEVESWKKAHEAAQKKNQRQTLELMHLKAAHQIALKNVQMTQAQLQELMALPMLQTSNKSQDEEIAALRKDKEELLRMVQDLQRQVAGLRVEQSESQSSPRAEHMTPVKITVQAAVPEALDMLRGYDEQTPENEGQGQEFEPMDFLQEEPREEEQVSQKTYTEDLIEKIKAQILAERDSQ